MAKYHLKLTYFRSVYKSKLMIMYVDGKPVKCTHIDNLYISSSIKLTLQLVLCLIVGLRKCPVF